MPRSAKKSYFPVAKVRRYLEPGPIVLVSSKWEGKANIMTLGWHTILDFSPSLIGLMISRGNHSFEMIRSSGQCVINLPTAALTDIVVGIGNTSGSDVDKFEQFGLTAEDAAEIDAPLIGECHASFECQMHDDALVEKYNFFIFEVVKAHVAASPKHPQTLHYTGDGVFMVSGKTISRRSHFKPRYCDRLLIARAAAIRSSHHSLVVNLQRSRLAGDLCCARRRPQVGAKMKKPIPLHDEQPRKIVRADIAPPDGYTLVVDGHFKNKYDGEAEAKVAAADLLSRYKMLKIEIYDGLKKERVRFS